MRILVAEDTKAIAILVERLLRSAGYEPTVVKDGEAALEKARQESFDLLLIDWMMPNLDGMGLLRALPAGHPPVVVMTSLPGDQAASYVRDAGAQGFVQKPIRGHTLLPALKAALRRSERVGRESRRPSGPQTGMTVLLAGPQGRRPLEHLCLDLGYLPGTALLVHQCAPWWVAHATKEALRKCSPLTVAEATDRTPWRPGHMYVTEQGSHTLFDGQLGCFVLDPASPPRNGARPSADVLIESMLDVFGDRSRIVVAGGIGRDGLEGLQLAQQAGAEILVLDPRRAADPELPKSAVATLGLTALRLPAIAEALASASQAA